MVGTWGLEPPTSTVSIPEPTLTANDPDGYEWQAAIGMPCARQLFHAARIMLTHLSAGSPNQCYCASLHYLYTRSIEKT